MLTRSYSIKVQWNYSIIILLLLALAFALDSQFQKGGMQVSHKPLVVGGMLAAFYLLPSQAKFLTLAEKVILPVVLAPIAFCAGLLGVECLLQIVTLLTGNSDFINLEEPSVPTSVIVLANLFWYSGTVLSYQMVTKAYRALFYSSLR